MTATTNGGNPHVVAGDQLDLDTTDSGIAVNTDSHFSKFSALINTEMTQLYVSTNVKPKDQNASEENEDG